MEDWAIVAGMDSRGLRIEGPPLRQTTREIWRTLETLNAYVTLLRLAGSERERQAYTAAIRRQAERIDSLGRAVIEQCRAGWNGEQPAG